MKMLANNMKFLLLLAAIFGANTSYLRPVTEEVPTDKNATAQTAALYKNLKKLTAKGYMFGHQNDLAYGVNWRYETGRSDVKEVAGDYPAVYGWELGGLEAAQEKNIDGVPFKKMRQYIKEGYGRGGVITISWHARSSYGSIYFTRW